MPDTILLVLGGLLLLISALTLLIPVLSPGKGVQDRHASALAIFKDQLAELERDRARGLISDDEVEAARVEIERRVLALNDGQASPSASNGRSGRVLVVSALLAPLLGVALYWTTSDPAARSGQAARDAREVAEIAALAQTVRDRLVSDPKSPTEGWLLLARTYSGLGQIEAALDAYATAAEREDVTAQGLLDYAELALMQDPSRTDIAARSLDRVLAGEDPNSETHTKAVYLRALAYANSDQAERGLELLDAGIETARSQEAVARLRELREVLRRQIVSTPALSTEQTEMAAAMSGEERTAFIADMVNGLAARLKENPEDLDGWIRLARAYSVLGLDERAAEAYRSANALLATLDPADPRREIVADGLADGS